MDKAVDCIGLGRNALRALPTDTNFQMRMDALENAIEQDKKNGIRPMCVVAVFGTTNTGAVDDARAARRIADRENMWLHVDAAYGGGMLLSREWPMRDRGLELADSITIDPDKWFYAALDAGAVLVRDQDRLTASLGKHMARQTTNLQVNPSEETIRLGPLAVCFLITRENSSGSIAAFELIVWARSAWRLPPIVTTITRRRSTASREC